MNRFGRASLRFGPCSPQRALHTGSLPWEMPSRASRRMVTAAPPAGGEGGFRSGLGRWPTPAAATLRCLLWRPPSATNVRSTFSTSAFPATGEHHLLFSPPLSATQGEHARVQRLKNQEEVSAHDFLPLLDVARRATPELRRDILSLAAKIKHVEREQADLLLYRLALVPASMEAARSVLELAKATSTATLATLTHYAEVAARNKELNEALAMQDLATKLQLTPDLSFYKALLKACSANKNLPKAIDLLHAMKKHGIKPTTLTYASVVQLCAKLSDVHSALKVMGMVEADGLPFDLPLLTAIVNACATRPGYAKRGLSVLGLMQQQGIVPDAQAFNAILRCCSQAEDISGMQRVFLMMKEQGVVSDEATMRSIIAGQVQQGQLQRALEIVDRFREVSVFPTVRTYSDLLFICKRTVDLAAAQDLLARMKEENVEPDWSIYNSLIDIHAHRNELEEAQRLFEEMLQRGLAPGQNTVGSLVIAMGLREGRLSEEAYAMVERVRGELGIPPGLPTFSPIISIFLKHNKIEEAWEVRRNMMERWQVEPDRVLNKHFLFALEPRRDVAKLDVLFDHMKTRPKAFFCHRKAINLLCLYRLRHRKRAYEVLDVLQRMNAAHKIHLPQLLEAVLGVLDYQLQKGRTREADRVFQFLSCSDIPPPAWVYARAFEMCRKPQQFATLLSFRKDMQRREIRFDRQAALAYLTALCRMDRLHEAVHFLHQVRSEMRVLPAHCDVVLRHAQTKLHLARKTLKLMDFCGISLEDAAFEASIREQVRQLSDQQVVTQ